LSLNFASSGLFLYELAGKIFFEAFAKDWRVGCSSSVRSTARDLASHGVVIPYAARQ
jgi:hypothetical protein